MKYLQKAFDEFFICEETDSITGKVYRKHDGQKFEAIIEILLKEMFPGLKWVPTQITNDGNKDFWAVKQGDIYWAECKNYASALELKIIAPTLLMAQLCNADEIYFFSVSPINSNTKKKICYYSQVNKKKVHFICDCVLENLLLQFEKTRAFFANIPSLSLGDSIPLLPEQYTLILKNPFLNIITNDQILGQPIEEISLNEIITEHVFVINNSPDILNFSIKIDTQNDDLYYFEYLEDCVPSTIGKISDIFSIRPYEVFTKTYNFRVAVYKPELQLPSLQVIYEDMTDISSENVVKQMIKCESVGIVPLIGEEYETINTMFETNLKSQKRLFVFLCKGKSGVGKTRMLEEAATLLIKNHYHLLNFVGLEENESSFSIIREIVFVLYNITEHMLEEMFFNNNPAGFQQELPTDISASVQLLYALYIHKHNIKAFLNDYGDIIYEKLSYEKYALIIDNLQYFDEGMLEFIKGMYLYAKNTNRKNAIVLCVTINEDYLNANIPAKKISHLLEKAENINYIQFYAPNVTGFSKNSALLFLKQLLKIKEETYDQYFYELINKANYIPYNIKHYAECLSENKKISSLVNNQRVIHNPASFVAMIDELPEKLEESLNDRWERMQYSFCSAHANINIERMENNFLYILSCLHIFRHLTYEGLCYVGCKKIYIKYLENFCFIKKVKNRNVYVYKFDHDLIENFFEKIAPNNLWEAEKRLAKQNLIDFEDSYPYVIHYLGLFNFTDIYTLQTNIIYGIDNELPYRLFLRFQQLSLKMLFKHWETFNDYEKCFNLARRICTSIRERFGGRYAHDFYKQLKKFFSKYPVQKLLTITGFSDVLFDTCENYHHMKEYKYVTTIYNKYLSAYEEECRIHPTEVNLGILSFIYNRLSIAYKHLQNKRSYELRDWYIDNSLNIAVNLKNRQYYAESLYDKAAFYYNRVENKEQFIKFCKQSCEEVDNQNIELMYLHNKQRKIRLAFVQGKRDEILKMINEGLDYIEDGEYSEYRFFFSKFFHAAKAMLYLLNKEKYTEALQETISSIRDTLAFGTNDIVFNQFLQAKIYFHLNEYIKSFESYKAAYLEIQNLALYEKDFLTEIILDDIKLRIRNFEHMDFSFLSNSDYKSIQQMLLLKDFDYEEYIKSYHAKSIISSDDGIENYPCI